MVKSDCAPVTIYELPLHDLMNRCFDGHADKTALVRMIFTVSLTILIIILCDSVL